MIRLRVVATLVAAFLAAMLFGSCGSGISGRTISGHVTGDDNGEPVGDTYVYTDIPGVTRQTASDARTDSDGYYELTAEPGGTVELRYDPPEETPYMAWSVTIRGVRSDEDLTVDVALPRDDGGVTITGSVLDAGDSDLAISDAYVYIPPRR